MLADDGAGLQVPLPTGGWSRPITLPPGHVVCFAGRGLEALSGGLFPACRHRVAPGAARCSVSFERRLTLSGARAVSAAAAPKRSGWSLRRLVPWATFG